jgi:hypothetical protein
MARPRRDAWFDALLAKCEDRPDVLRAARADRKRHPQDWATREAAEQTLLLVVEVLDAAKVLAARGPDLAKIADVTEAPRMYTRTRRSSPVRHDAN